MKPAILLLAGGLILVASDARAAVADLSIVATPSRAPVLSGVPTTWTVSITNRGPDTATGVFLLDSLPGAFITAVVSTHGSVPCSALGFEGLTSYSCGPLTIPAGGSETLTITMNVNVGTGHFAHQPSVTSDATDPNSANNFSSALQVDVLPATALVPALSPVLLALLGVVFGAVGLVVLRR